jgi:outer membrane protein assembly factor BamB
MDSQEQAIGDRIFVGLNSRVIAVDRYSGGLLWDWKAPKGMGFVTVLLDGDRLIVSVSGYLYCLDPATGEIVWDNPLKGFGNGIVCLASARGYTTVDAPTSHIAQQQRRSSN